ncbi:hypothetical protein LPTSP3_g13050 [Leptospira kobayashii]|uniref:Sulfatase N-terminal domain-containing protein n=1 Tax=Leptospira kobayashii TaxID=1917830 RepID=A0ABM7UI31_9LEPT|nr:hypothetical protein LPTSP3_g13050 [Leptospira kobayashii]
MQNPERKVSNRTVFDSKPNIDFTIPKLSKDTDIVVFFLEGVGKKDLNLNRSQNFSKKNPVWEVDHFYISVPHSSKSIFTALTGVTQIRETRPNLNPLHLSASLPKILERNGYETIFLFSQPSVFENIDEMAKRLFQIHYDKEKLKSKLNSRYSEFSWGLDDRSLLDFVKKYLPDFERPMFLWVGFSNTHSPYFVSDSNPFPAENSSDPHSRFLSALQFNLSLVDEMINEITKKRGRDTLFILTSDHGESFGERGFFGHNYSVYNSETLVPFMIRYTKSNERKHFPVGSLSDFKTSLLALFDFPDVGIREEKNFFNKEYKIEHKFKSWNSDSYMGYLEGEKKWIYHSQSDRLFLTNWDETVETELMNRKDKSDFFKRFHKEDP